VNSFAVVVGLKLVENSHNLGVQGRKPGR
jgi:hypothetical protein